MLVNVDCQIEQASRKTRMLWVSYFQVFNHNEQLKLKKGTFFTGCQILLIVIITSLTFTGYVSWSNQKKNFINIHIGIVTHKGRVNKPWPTLFLLYP